MSDTGIWSRADLHIHTNHSDGVASVPEIMEHVATRTDLRVIAITDHNTIDGALFAQSLAELHGFDVIVGEEVSAREGHVIGLFLEKAIPAGMTALDTVKAIKEQNGVAVIPHPFSAQGVFGPRGRGRFIEAAQHWGFDAFEVQNSLPYLGWANGRAADMLENGCHAAATGGSDAHVLNAVGKCYTVFRGSTAQDLRSSIAGLETRAETLGAGFSLALSYMFRYPQIRRLQARNWELCKSVA